MSEEKLRERLNGFQEWMEAEINAGHIDIDNTPEAFDRAAYGLKKVERDMRLIGSYCKKCNEPFKDGEAKTTEDHINFYHATGCQKTNE